MITGFGLATLALLVACLMLFFRGSALAAQAAGRPIWRFARARDRVGRAGTGFRAAFALGFFGPLPWLAIPMLRKTDPLWTEGTSVAVAGIFVAGLGFAASALTVLAPLLLPRSAVTQVRTEVAEVRAPIGPQYDRYAASVPRWRGIWHRVAR